MQNIQNFRELEARIDYLENQREESKSEIRLHYEEVVKSFNPLHLLRESIESAISEPDLKEDFIQTISMSSGFLAKKLIVRRSKNAFLKLVGSLAQYGVSIWVSQKLHEDQNIEPAQSQDEE